jgi:hypothetical protein
MLGDAAVLYLRVTGSYRAKQLHLTREMFVQKGER